jgi:hypothetical protein
MAYDIPEETRLHAQELYKETLKKQWNVDKVDDPVVARLVVKGDKKTATMNAHLLHPKHGEPFYVAVEVFPEKEQKD